MHADSPTSRSTNYGARTSDSAGSPVDPAPGEPHVRYRKSRTRAMPNEVIIYEEQRVLTAKYHDRRSDDYLQYNARITIKVAGKNRTEMSLVFSGILPFAAPMPPIPKIPSNLKNLITPSVPIALLALWRSSPSFKSYTRKAQRGRLLYDVSSPNLG